MRERAGRGRLVRCASVPVAGGIGSVWSTPNRDLASSWGVLYDVGFLYAQFLNLPAALYKPTGWMVELVVGWWMVGVGGVGDVMVM